MDSLFLLAFIAFVICLPIYLTKRRNNKEWVGTVDNKEIITYFNHGGRIKYMLYFHNDSGEKIVSDVSEFTYNSLNIGDRVQKSKGRSDPMLIL